MGEGNFRRVQKYPRRRCSPVKRVAENRETALRRMNANLVRAAGERSKPRPHCSGGRDRRHWLPQWNLRRSQTAATRSLFPRFPPPRTARIFFAEPEQSGFYREFFCRHGLVGEQEIFFADAALRELFRERAVGERRFAKDQHAAGFLVQPVQNRQRRPSAARGGAASRRCPRRRTDRARACSSRRACEPPADVHLQKSRTAPCPDENIFPPRNEVWNVSSLKRLANGRSALHIESGSNRGDNIGGRKTGEIESLHDVGYCYC